MAVRVYTDDARITSKRDKDKASLTMLPRFFSHCLCRIFFAGAWCLFFVFFVAWFFVLPYHFSDSPSLMWPYDRCFFLVFFVTLEPSPPVNYRFSVGQLPAWAKKQVGGFSLTLPFSFFQSLNSDCCISNFPPPKKEKGLVPVPFSPSDQPSSLWGPLVLNVHWLFQRPLWYRTLWNKVQLLHPV